jgi:oligopeptide transport system ATP-binding protein
MGVLSTALSRLDAAGAGKTPLLEIRGLTTRFSTHEGEVHAVNAVSYSLGQGEIVGIVGESGCGKSVSMLSLMRLIPEPPGRIVDGKVIFKGRDLLQLSEAEMARVRGAEIAMIFQDPMTSLNPTLTIGYQITETLKRHQGMDTRQARHRAAELLSMVGVPNPLERLRDYPHQFSGGMRQRAMIAIALSCNPLLLIADEPTTALDVTVQAQIVDLVIRLQKYLGMTVVWITHDLGVVTRLVERVIVMYAGYVVEDAPVDDLYARPRHPYTLGLMGSLPKLNQAAGTTLVSIPGQPPNLATLPPGCPFAPRCRYAVERCREANPGLNLVALEHQVACWQVDQTKGAWGGFG